MPLALVVVNDNSVRCKKMAAIAIKALLTRLSPDQRNTLYDLVNTWLTSEKVPPLFSQSFNSTQTLLFNIHKRDLLSLRPACGDWALRSAACLWR